MILTVDLRLGPGKALARSAEGRVDVDEIAARIRTT
jgi:hypothetical protein